MKEILIFAALLSTSILQMAIAGTFLLVIFNKKIEWKKILVFGLINGGIAGFTRSLIPEYLAPINFTLYIVAIVISLRFVYRFRLVHIILGICINYAMSVIDTLITFAVYKIQLGDKFDAIKWSTTFPNNVIMQNVGNLFYIVIVLLLFYLKMNIKIPEDINKKRAFGIAVNVIILSILLVPNILFFERTTMEIPIELIIFNLVSVLMFLALSTFNSVKFGELESKKQEVEFQKLYIQTLNDSIDSLRGFKHDFNNMIQVISGYLDLNDIEGLKKFHKQMRGELRKVNNILPINSFIKGNPAIYGLLLSKLSYSEIKDIEFNVSVVSNVKIENIKTYDFCKVLGILLDNALEAAVESEKKYVELNIMDNSNRTCLVVEIINTYSGEVNMESIYKNGFTTKDDHSGFGLWEVKNKLSKNKHCTLRTTTDRNLFIQRIEIQY